jgi:Pyruvate/2-oxoacid:ferredoxin oxidoreductase delta subunit
MARRIIYSYCKDCEINVEVYRQNRDESPQGQTGVMVIEYTYCMECGAILAAVRV